MSELRTMAMDITKNSGDIENYSKEFIELQSQMNQIGKQQFNGISIFSTNAATATAGVLSHNATQAYGGGGTYEAFSRTLYTSASGLPENGSISLNVVNLEFVLSIGTAANGADLGGFANSTANLAALNFDEADLGGTKFLADITDVAIDVFNVAIEKLADMRAENGAEQNRIMNSIEFLQTNMTNLEAAHGRIMDADIALESTRFARQNVLVQASAAMTAQANQLTNVALQLLG